MTRRALITGITGQDGSYLAELLLSKGYEVWGLARRDSWMGRHHASHLEGKIQPCFGDMSDGSDITTAVIRSRPDEIYNLASQSRPGESWNRAAETLIVNGMGAVRLFEAVRTSSPNSRVYHASSSDMYGEASCTPQVETTPFNPTNPYAAAKVYAHNMVHIYRKSFGLFIASGILFNHESERRPLNFVTQKIAYGAACAALGIEQSTAVNERGQPVVSGGKLSLGNLDVSRDWGHAKDFVNAMWLILQHSKAEDFVIGTGKLHTLRQLCAAAYSHVGLDWQDYVISDKELMRPAETGQTVADASKARRELNWTVTIPFEEMVGQMVEAQILQLKHTSNGQNKIV